MARVPKIKDARHSTLSHTTVFIKGVSRLVDVRAGGDFLDLCDQKIHIVKNMYIYTPIWMSRDWISITVATKHRGADKSLARPGRKQATAIEDFEFHIAYL